MTLKFLRTISLALTAVALLSAATAHAQFRTSVQGVVTDPQGAAIPNATATLVHEGTGATATRTSDTSMPV